jgi:hypothetical protein
MLDEIIVKNVPGQKMPFHFFFWSHFIPTFAESGESKCYIFVACLNKDADGLIVGLCDE